MPGIYDDCDTYGKGRIGPRQTYAQHAHMRSIYGALFLFQRCGDSIDVFRMAGSMRGRWEVMHVFGEEV